MLGIFRDLFAPPRHMILLIAAFWIGVALAEKRVERHGLSREDLNHFAFTGLIAFILGGRITYVIQNLPIFQIAPLGIISINPDLFDTTGAIASGILVLIVYSQRRELSLWALLDASTPIIAVLGVGSGLSHLANGSEFGLPTDMPWAVTLWNANRHPTQIYDTFVALLIFSIMWAKKPGFRPGMDFLLFTAFTAGAWLFLEGFKADSITTANEYNRQQIAAWIILASCFIAIELRIKKPKRDT